MTAHWYESKISTDENGMTFATKYFKNIFMYSRLLLSEHFYSRFSEYEYMLVVQPDVWILSEDDKLDYFMQFAYDYIGAPWKQEEKLYPVIFKGMNHLEKVAKKWEYLQSAAYGAGWEWRNEFAEDISYVRYYQKSSCGRKNIENIKTK